MGHGVSEAVGAGAAVVAASGAAVVRLFVGTGAGTGAGAGRGAGLTTGGSGTITGGLDGVGDGVGDFTWEGTGDGNGGGGGVGFFLSASKSRTSQGGASWRETDVPAGAADDAAEAGAAKTTLAPIPSNATVAAASILRLRLRRGR